MEDLISREQAIKQCGFGMTSLLIADCLRRLPSVSVSENAIDKQIVLDMLEDINKETDGCGFEYKHWREYIDSLPTVNNLRNLSKCFDGMPNGEVMNLVLRKIFPRTIFIRGNDPCHKIKSINYSEEWENAPYKAERNEE